MKNRKSAITKICRAGVIGALYVVMTLPLSGFAFGPIQIRPAEGLAILPLLFPETVGGLFVGCMLVNILSGFGLYDVFLGSLATLIAGVITYLIGRLIKNKPVRIILGGLPPVVINAFAVPAIWLLAGSDIAYFLEVAIMLLNEGVWVYAIGIPLYLVCERVVIKYKK